MREIAPDFAIIRDVWQRLNILAPPIADHNGLRCIFRWCRLYLVLCLVLRLVQKGLDMRSQHRRSVLLSGLLSGLSGLSQNTEQSTTRIAVCTAASCIITACMFTACTGPAGQNGQNGQDGTDGQNGQNGTGCTVRDNGDNTATLTCPDGSSVIIPSISDPTDPTDPTDPILRAEVCSGGIDEDANGLIDCEDTAACATDALCINAIHDVCAAAAVIPVVAGISLDEAPIHILNIAADDPLFASSCMSIQDTDTRDTDHVVRLEIQNNSNNNNNNNNTDPQTGVIVVDIEADATAQIGASARDVCNGNGFADRELDCVYAGSQDTAQNTLQNHARLAVEADGRRDPFVFIHTRSVTAGFGQAQFRAALLPLDESEPNAQFDTATPIPIPDVGSDNAGLDAEGISKIGYIAPDDVDIWAIEIPAAVLDTWITEQTTISIYTHKYDNPALCDLDSLLEAHIDTPNISPALPFASDDDTASASGLVEAYNPISSGAPNGCSILTLDPAQILQAYQEQNPQPQEQPQDTYTVYITVRNFFAISVPFVYGLSVVQE